jgi:hypothetical protein
MTCDEYEMKMQPVLAPFLPDELQVLPQKVTRKKVTFRCPNCGHEVTAELCDFDHKASWKGPQLN